MSWEHALDKGNSVYSNLSSKLDKMPKFCFEKHCKTNSIKGLIWLLTDSKKCVIHKIPHIVFELIN